MGLLVLAQQSPRPQLIGALRITHRCSCFKAGLTERRRDVASGPVQGECCWFCLFSLLTSTAATRFKHLLPFKFFPDATWELPKFISDIEICDSCKRPGTWHEAATCPVVSCTGLPGMRQPGKSNATCQNSHFRMCKICVYPVTPLRIPCKYT